MTAVVSVNQQQQLNVVFDETIFEETRKQAKAKADDAITRATSDQGKRVLKATTGQCVKTSAPHLKATSHNGINVICPTSVAPVINQYITDGFVETSVKYSTDSSIDTCANNKEKVKGCAHSSIDNVVDSIKSVSSWLYRTFVSNN